MIVELAIIFALPLTIVFVVLIVEKRNTNLTIKVLRDALSDEIERHRRTKQLRNKQAIELIRLREFHERFTALIANTKKKKRVSQNDKLSGGGA